MNKLTRSYLFIFLAIVLGIITGLFHNEILFKVAESISTVFTNFLKLLAAPIVFLSIISTFLGMQGFEEMRTLGRKVFAYTLLTTVIATLIALVLFLAIDPVRGLIPTPNSAEAAASDSYLSFLLQIVPSNFFQAFLENNVIALAFIAALFGMAALKLPIEERQTLNQFFSSLFKLMLKVTELVIALMPMGIWAFTALLIEDLRHNFSHFNSLILYLSCVLGANLLQGLVVLPLLLKSKGISPLQTAKGAMKALLLAFFSKSSNATLPVTLDCAEKQLGVSSRVAHFSLPLCTVINMNGCAAFIFTTVVFISSMHGHVFSPFDLGMWVVLATIAAIGNAGVPMGCFFLSSTFLIAMNVPITTMGLILPFYAFLDMVETMLNVWSDLCVTAIVDKELKAVPTRYSPEPI
ncbi:MAG TPA: dicarboxylate/amino acid:cation symporter [Chlamydiales bacterium]|nr:dicarboxylate/amino acid:cation symporter [Chlamydiales bacterium]